MSKAAAHADDGSFAGSSQTLDQVISVDTEPALSGAKAAKRAPASKEKTEPKLVVDAAGSEPKPSARSPST
ncbi:hypothetical protein [Aeromicrobium sp.]|uniref:hypothetical protein n=1 Tax=Aeromicrobium sp. TaxID=1871063 RepID=UPI003D6B2F8F